MKLHIKNTAVRFKHWLTDVREDHNTPQSVLHKVLEKLPLLMAMYVSSVLIGISTYNTFPSTNEFLRMSSAIIGGMAFDIILTSTVFSKRKNAFSIGTILVALLTGSMIALDLYLSLDFKWLHALYIVLSTMYALHAATTRRVVPSTKLVQRTSPVQRSTPRLALARQETYPTPVQVTSDVEPSTSVVQEATSVQDLQEWHCPHCTAKLSSKQALGSARRRGHCPHCKV